MKKSNLIVAFAAILMIVSLVAGCASPAPTVTSAPTAAATSTLEPPPSTGLTITDALGRTVTFDTLPQRIVVAGKASALILDAMYMFPEAVDRVISYGKTSQTGKSFLPVIDPKLAEKTGFDNNVGAEQIAPLKPDLVVLKDYLKDSMGAPLEALGIKVVYLNLETTDTFNRDVRTIGQLFGDSERADAIVAYYEGAVKAVTGPLQNLKDADRPGTLLLEYSDKGGTVAFNVAPASWLQTDLVKLAGGNPVWTDVPTQGGWTVVTLEQIAAWNPQMIFIVDYAGNAVDIVSQLKSDPQWSVLDAVKNSKIYAFPVDFLSWDQADPRWALGLTWLATKLQPSVFGSVDMTAEVTNFYNALYVMDDAAITSQVIPLVKGD